MTTREKAPTILTAEGARRLTAAIRNDLGAADAKLARAFEGRIWEVSTPPRRSFEEWCAAELPEMQHISLRKGPRQERARMLLEQGATEREIAAATGSSVGTAHNDVLALTGRDVLKNEQAPESRADQIVRLVASRGDRGATSPEVARLARCSQGAASGCLSRLQRQGRVRPTREHRGGFGIYMVTP